jgi:uncharacterized membrane protein YcfT
MNESAMPSAAHSDFSGERVEWVDIAKGICMMSVVILYAVNKLDAVSGGSGWLKAWADFTKPFRMPDFFLLSGLLLHRAIDRPWKDYLDKKVFHYVYFFILWSVIYHLTEVGAFRAGLVRGQGDASTLWHKLVEPFAMLWFIQLLPAFFLLTRLIRRFPAWIVLPIAVALQVFPPRGTHAIFVMEFCERFVFFYLGHLFAGAFFGLADWAQSRKSLALLGVALWMLLNETLVLKGWAPMKGVALGLGVLGAFGLTLGGTLLVQLRQAAWLKYLGRNSFVVYLGFYLPMFLTLIVLRRTHLGLDKGTMGAVASILSVFAALSLFWITKKSWLRFLFARPAWAMTTHVPSSALKEEPELG